MRHECHAVRCDVPVPERMFMCRRHWAMVPRAMQREVWGVYVEGQEVRKDPTDAYLATTRRVRLHVAELEGIELTEIERRVLSND